MSSESQLQVTVVELPPATTSEQADVQTKTDGKKNKGRSYLKYRPDGICEYSGCKKPVPGGMVPANTKRYFCSKECPQSEWLSQNVIGTCQHCGGSITGQTDRKESARYCSVKCRYEAFSDELLASTGCFREPIEEFISARIYSNESTLGLARSCVCRFFHYIVQVEKVNRFEDITPGMVTRFLAAEKSRGKMTNNCVSFISVFFNWLIDEERFDRRNPVIPRLHASDKRRRTRQPYEEHEISYLRKIVEESNDTQLKLMFEIGLESGLRNGEVCNIRLSDVNLTKQVIYVRLPTKNGEPRTVEFHRRVKKLLEQWLLERDEHCDHDHLFHNTRLRQWRS